MYLQLFGSYACLFGLFVVGSAARVGLSMIAAGGFAIGYFSANQATQLLMLPSALLFAGVLISHFFSVKTTVAIVVSGFTLVAALVLYATGR